MKIIVALVFSLWMIAPLQANEAQAKQLRKNFDNCFWDSAAAQIEENRKADVGLVAENAFLACATEERAMRVFMRAYRMDQATIETVLVSARLDLKRQLQNIKKNPSAYQPK